MPDTDIKELCERLREHLRLDRKIADSNARRSAHFERHAAALAEALEHPQWSVIAEAVEKYSRGEKGDLVTLGIVAQGVLLLDEARRAALDAYNKAYPKE